MKILILIGGLAVIGLIAVGVWFLLENLTLKSGKGKRK